MRPVVPFSWLVVAPRAMRVHGKSIHHEGHEQYWD